MFLLSIRKFYTNDHSGTEEVLTFNHQVCLDLPEQFPTASEAIVLFISYMDSTQYMVTVRAEGAAYTYIPVTVPASGNTGLVSDTQSPRIVISPKGFRTDMSAGCTFVPFQIDIAEILPCVMVTCLVLVGKSHVHAPFI